MAVVVAVVVVEVEVEVEVELVVVLGSEVVPVELLARPSLPSWCC